MYATISNIVKYNYKQLVLLISSCSCFHVAVDTVAVVSAWDARYVRWICPNPCGARGYARTHCWVWDERNHAKPTSYVWGECTMVLCHQVMYLLSCLLPQSQWTLTSLVMLLTDHLDTGHCLHSTCLLVTFLYLLLCWCLHVCRHSHHSTCSRSNQSSRSWIQFVNVRTSGVWIYDFHCRVVL